MEPLPDSDSCSLVTSLCLVESGPYNVSLKFTWRPWVGKPPKKVSWKPMFEECSSLITQGTAYHSQEA